AFRLIKGIITLPGHRGGSLASRMGQLDRWNGAVVFQEAGNPLISLGLFIVPDSCICRADPSLRAYGCCFLDDTGGTADCATAQVNQEIGRASWRERGENR